MNDTSVDPRPADEHSDSPASSADPSLAASGPSLLRRLAERRTSPQPPGAESLSAEDAARLLHELRVHQIELEMQNEELRRAQEALEAQRVKYFDLYDLAPVGYITVNERGQILEANLTAASLWRAPRSALTGQPLARFVSSEDQDAYRGFNDRLFHASEPQASELRMARQDRTTFWARLEGRAAQDAPGNAPTGRIAIIDIDDRKRAEIDLRASEERFRAFVKATDGIIFILDPSQRHTAVYGDWIERAGLSPAYFLGRAATDIYSPAEARVHEQANRRALAGEHVVYEWTAQSQGQSRVYETSLAPMRDERGRVIGVAGWGRDITERKLSEQALRESEERHRVIAETMSDYVYSGTAYPDGRVETGWISGAVERITGYTFAELRSMPGGFASLLLPEDLQKVIRLQPRLRADGFLDVEYRIRARSGEIRWLRDYMRFGQADPTAPAAKLIGAVQDITERKLAQLALQRNEDNLQAVMNAISESVLLIEPDGTVVIANTTTARRLNTTVEQLVGQCAYDFVEAEVASRRRAHAAQVAATGQPVSFMDTHGGRHLVNAIAPVFDAQGRVARLAIFGFDITERVLAEEDLRRSQQSLARAQHIGRLGSWDWDVPGNSLAWSDELYRIFGIDRAVPLTFDGIAAMLHPDDRERNAEMVRRVLAAADQDAWEFRIVRADGQVRHLSQSVEVTRDASGLPTRLFGTMQDITERIQAEERLRQSEADLRKAQRIAHVGNWTWHVHTNRLEWSDEIYRIFGIDPADFSGDLTEVVACAIHPDDRATVERANAAVRGGAGSIPMEYRVVRPDGTVRTVWAEPAELVVDAEGKAARLSGIVQDITERKRAEESIRRLNAELEQRVRDRTAQLEASNHELEAFAYTVSHDLRAPLRALDGFSAILLAEKAGQLDDEGQEFLRRVQQAAQRMGQLIDDLLNLSRIARRDMARQPVDLADIARQIAAELRQTAPLRQAEFIIPPALVVNGDAHLLRIVLTNLLGNAWKFTAPRAQARIELGETRRDGQRAVFVRDNGVGFNMTYVDKLFKPFQRLHGADQFPGTGIGLATVQRILARHGGRVWAEAAVNQGAVFYFTVGET